MDVTTQFGASETFRLRKALLVYEGDSRAYVTLHNVTDGQLDAGAPPSRIAVQELVSALGRDSAFSGFVHPRVLFIGSGVTIWWLPTAPRRVWFDTTGRPAGDQTPVKIGKRSAVTVHPDLVFAVSGNSWFVFALAAAGRPTPEAKLYRAPYFNVYTDGAICEGNTRPPALDGPAAIEARERIFFESRFTHPNINATEKLVDWKGGAGALWTHLLDRGTRLREFPAKALVDAKIRIRDLPKAIVRGRRG